MILFLSRRNLTPVHTQEARDFNMIFIKVLLHRLKNLKYYAKKELWFKILLSLASKHVFLF